MSITDQPFLTAASDSEFTQATQALAEIESDVAAFFDKYLKSSSQTILDSSEVPYSGFSLQKYAKET